MRFATEQLRAFNEADRRRLYRYISANLTTNTSSVLALVVIYFTKVRTAWILIDAAIVLGVELALLISRRYVTQNRITGALYTLALANWVAAIATTAITPFVLPMITVVVLLPVVLMVSYLDKRSLRVSMVLAAAVSLIAAIVARLDFVHVIEPLAPQWLKNVILLIAVPMVVGLLALCAWQNHMGVVLQTEELKRSRARVVAEADRTRSQIEMDLHDGTQQRLISISVQLGLLRRIIERDPARAAELSQKLAAELDDTMTELRDLAHGIYPPLLSQRGLADALNAAALRSPVSTSVFTNNIGRYPVAVETAIYFCCLEAATNAIKHAGPFAEVAINLNAAKHLEFSVTDTGVGFDATALSELLVPSDFSGGNGFTNMRDRVVAAGGTLTIDSRIGVGTTITGSIPLAPNEDT